jgi:two-component system, cell cycle sensor histidine kinase and response regulator CckA
MSAIPGTVLVADDDSHVRAFVAKVLRQTGYQVIEAADGVEALELATRHAGHIDFLVTDVRMPRMEGPELCTRMRTKSPATGLVIMSGYSDGALDSEVVFLAKPFSVHELLHSLRQAMKEADANSPPEIAR